MIVVYDVEQKRIPKVLKLLRRYLNWIQNSAFEGDITPSKLEELKTRLKKLIDKEKDSVIIFKMNGKPYEKEIIGVSKSSEGKFL
ncbi:MAG: CRISPR-associated protein Cas2 [Thermotogota bacterium]|nr:CRISPR-associated protein Cas2 [Thermotogota bacterium]